MCVRWYVCAHAHECVLQGYTCVCVCVCVYVCVCVCVCVCVWGKWLEGVGWLCTAAYLTVCMHVNVLLLSTIKVHITFYFWNELTKKSMHTTLFPSYLWVRVKSVDMELGTTGNNQVCLPGIKEMALYTVLNACGRVDLLVHTVHRGQRQRHGEWAICVSTACPVCNTRGTS